MRTGGAGERRRCLMGSVRRGTCRPAFTDAHARLVPLSPPTARVLAGLPRIEGSPRVVPGLKPGRHLADLNHNTSMYINVLRDVQSAPSGSPRSSKYFLVTLNTIGASRRRPMRFGTAISPLRVSDRFQTKSTLTLANESAATIHSAR